MTFQLEVSEWGLFGSDSSQIGFWGYVDAERSELGGVVWTFDLIRDDKTWQLERTLNVNRNTTDYQETLAELPASTFEGSAELASLLPGLVSELLELSAPEPVPGP